LKNNNCGSQEIVPLIDEQLNKLKKIMTEDVGKLNQLIHEKLLPVIGVKKEDIKPE
jgi:hypothetical protein